MKKSKQVTNPRIVIDLDDWNRWERRPKTEREIKREADGIIAEIKRHVDLPYRSSPGLEWDWEYTCPWCGHVSDDRDSYDECCDDAILDRLEQTERKTFCPKCLDEVTFGELCTCGHDEPVQPAPYTEGIGVYTRGHWPRQ